MSTGKVVEILIIEDDEGHAELIQDGLNEAGIQNQIKHFFNGEEAWDFLSSSGKDSSRDPNKTYLLLLDLNMPKMDGVEVLRKVKGNAELKDFPIIILTTTDDPREVEECYHLGCNFYITKPVDFIKFTDVLKKLGLFLQIVKL